MRSEVEQVRLVTSGMSASRCPKRGSRGPPTLDWGLQIDGWPIIVMIVRPPALYLHAYAYRRARARGSLCLHSISRCSGSWLAEAGSAYVCLLTRQAQGSRTLSPATASSGDAGRQVNKQVDEVAVSIAIGNTHKWRVLVVSAPWLLL